jgi:hypothetical protein
MILSYLTHKNGSDFYTDRIKKNKINPKVFDLGYKYLPNYTDNIYLLIIINLMCCGFLLVHFGLGYDILNEYMYYFIIIMFIRLIMINVTILPKTKTCDNNFNLKHTINGHCYDKIFSGHFASFLLLLVILYNKNIYTNIPVLFLVGLFHAFLIILTRAHYTIDIIVAIFVVLFVYFNIPMIKSSK